MHTLSKSNGLFARRRAIKKDGDSFLQTFLFWLAGILLGLILCGFHDNSKAQPLSHDNADAITAVSNPT